MKKTVLMAAALATMLFGFSVESRAAGLVANIDISSQTMTVKYGLSVYRWRVSTARSGYVTPRGSYRPKSLAAMHYSRKYHDSPMPHSVFFRGGYAVHGTYSIAELGRPASHGCIRLAPRNAATLFQLIRSRGAGGARIVVS